MCILFLQDTLKLFLEQKFKGLVVQLLGSSLNPPKCYMDFMLVEGCITNRNDLKLRMILIVESWSILYDASDHPFSNCLP